MIPLKMIGENPYKLKPAKKPTKKIRVGLAQLNSSFSDQCYLPLSIGTLQAYAQEHLVYADDYEFLMPIYTFMPINQAVEILIEADIVGFSVYVWNFENSLAIARELKRLKPNIIIVFGGPHVPDGKKQFRRVKTSNQRVQSLEQEKMSITERFHRKYPFINIACHGEGEKIFKIILERMAIDNCEDLSEIPSISFLDSSSNFIHNDKLERMRDLMQVPSPYLTHVFDPLILANPKQKWIAMWETNRGCPYQCTYCDWGGATEDRISSFSMDNIRQEVLWFGEHKIPYIFLADANFGILKQDIEIARYLAEVKKATGYPEGVSVQNAKNPKPHTLEAIKILEEAGLSKATVMSIQSKNPQTLRAVRRENMRPEEYQENQKRLRAQGIYTMTDYIIPMPMETYDSVLDGISEIISEGQHDRIQFNNLSILPNAEMGDPEYQRKYQMETVRTPITNIHGKKNTAVNDIEEYQELVIATSTMSREDWVKTRSLCYMVGLIYFNKLFQIPIIILHEVYGITYRKIFEMFMEHPRQSSQSPVFTEILDFFEEFSRGIQDGTQEEFFHSKKYLDILWPPDEYAFIKVCQENKLEKLYAEARTMMMLLVGPRQLTGPLFDALKLNKSLIKLPFQDNDMRISLSHNIWEIYRYTLIGQTKQLKFEDHSYTIDRTNETWKSWDEWYQKMVWWGNRRGAYLYGNKNPHEEIAGHH